MQVFDCVLAAANFLSDTNMIDILCRISGDDGASLSDAEKKKVNSYIGAFNIASATVAAEEVPLYDEKVVVSDGDAKIDYGALSDRLFEVCGVKSYLTEVRCDFYALPFALFVPRANEKYIIRFKYLPVKAKTLFDQIELSPLVLPEVLAKLMVSDILLSKNSYDEASVWRNEYRRAIGSVLQKKRRSLIPFRRLV